jgi:ribosomal-protein-alanine N-acetyltransferase
LTLRALTFEDTYDLYSWASEPDVSQFTLWHPHRNLSDSCRYIEAVHERELSFLAVEWGIEHDRRLIGTIGLYDRKGPSAYLGYALSKSHWGQGLTVEAAQALLENVLRPLSLQSIYAKTAKANTASIRVLEKIGFQFERQLPESMEIKDQLHEILVFKWIPRSQVYGV